MEQKKPPHADAGDVERVAKATAAQVSSNLMGMPNAPRVPRLTDLESRRPTARFGTDRAELAWARSRDNLASDCASRSMTEETTLHQGRKPRVRSSTKPVGSTETSSGSALGRRMRPWAGARVTGRRSARLVCALSLLFSCGPGSETDAGPVDSGVDSAVDSGALDAGRDAAPADAGECSIDEDCAPAGLGRCSSGICLRCDPEVLEPVAFEGTERDGETLAVEALVRAGEARAAVVQLGEAGNVRVTSVALEAHLDTSRWQDSAGFEQLTGERVRDALGCAARSTGEDMVLGCLAHVGGSEVPQVVLGRLSGGWVTRLPSPSAVQPTFAVGGADAISFGWMERSGATSTTIFAADAGAAAVIDSGAFSSAGREARASGSSGAWMVSSEGATLTFWRPDGRSPPTQVARPAHIEPASLTHESGDRYLLAYGQGELIWIRRLSCGESCSFDPSSTPGGAVISGTGMPHLVRVEAIPGGGVIVAYVADGDTVAYAQVLSRDLSVTGARVRLASVEPTHRIVSLDGDVLVHEDVVHAPFALLAARPGSLPDNSLLLGLRFPRTCR